MKKKVIAVIILILIALTGFSVYKYIDSIKEEPKLLTEIKLTYKNITSEEAKIELDKDNTIIVLDVRTEEEYEEGRIPNSVLIPLNELENRALNELQDKQGKIFVYCRSGVRSVTACEILINLGYSNIYNLGGIIDWKYEIE